MNHHGPPLTKLIAVAIDKDRGSQIALKWAVDNLLARGQTVILIHVKVKGSATNRLNQDASNDGSGMTELEPQLKELFLPFRVFCTRKDIQCYDVVLEDADVVKAIIEYINRTAIEVLILGAAAKGGLLRFKLKDIPGNVVKGVPDFCTVYVISKSGKISSTRSAARLAPFIHPLRHQFMQHANDRSNSIEDSNPPPRGSFSGVPKPVSDMTMSNLHSDTFNMKSPFTHRKGPNGKPYEISQPDTDISFVSSGRPSIDSMFPSFADSYDSGATPPRLSAFSDFEGQNFESMPMGRRSLDILPSELTFLSMEGDRTSISSTQVGNRRY
ncbi:hypothetical protein T459_01276 [Capsicum annuum]|uniref:RING-type E3 ubiquitin transferase n=1 Tax=Capsicum annuum TaxID=4072 RepID=A0A2G3AGP6_CAPAN|nr:hypothetical protein T459_01276 [Capsicum annuum]